MTTKCNACRDGIQQPIPFSMAFQPIVNVATSNVFAYEALVRGPRNEGAFTVLSQVNETNRYAFDQSCRVKAITLAQSLELTERGAKLSINFMPGAVYSPAACIQLTLKTATKVGFPMDHLIFEVTEGEEVHDPKHLQAIAEEYRKHGFQIAIDDFGAGYANLNLLADLSASVLKLDMDLTRNLQLRPKAKAIVRSTVSLCRELGVTVIAEGIETVHEMLAVQDCGVYLMQGYLFAKPLFEGLPEVAFPLQSKSNKAGSETLSANHHSHIELLSILDGEIAA